MQGLCLRLPPYHVNHHAIPAVDSTAIQQWHSQAHLIRLHNTQITSIMPCHLALSCAPTSYPTGSSGSRMPLNTGGQSRSSHHWLEAQSPAPTAQVSP
jgi:hypothetical protein